MIKKKVTCFSLNYDVYRKLNVICTVQKMFFGDSSVTMSGTIEKALEEYFENHKEEIGKMFADYHEKGGCAELKRGDA